MTELFNRIAEQLVKGEITREQAVRLFEAASAERERQNYEELVAPIVKAAKAKKPTKKELREAEERADSKTGRTIAEVHADWVKKQKSK